MLSVSLARLSSVGGGGLGGTRFVGGVDCWMRDMSARGGVDGRLLSVSDNSGGGGRSGGFSSFSTITGVGGLQGGGVLGRGGSSSSGVGGVLGRGSSSSGSL